MTAKKNFQELLTRGVSKIIKPEELEAKLVAGQKMRIYLGVDPSSSVVHLGHAVALRKLRQFQELGQQIIFLIGDFTGQVGDPTGRSSQRQLLTHEQALANAQSYQEQVGKILDFKNNPPLVEFNSQWLGKLTFTEVFQLAQHFTVQQMLERDMFAERYKNGQPISLVEFLYPLMQGYDSVALDVDLELGGNDQLFNMLAGRTLLEKLKNKTKCVMTLDLLEGTDGRKMSKSYNNYVALTDSAKDMFGKIMSLKDELIIKYFILTTDVALQEIKEFEKELHQGANPRDYKARLAREVVKIYHGQATAEEASQEFDEQFKNKQKPKVMPELIVSGPTAIIEIMIIAKLAASKSAAKRLIEQGGVKVNDQKINLAQAENKTTWEHGTIIQVGKLKYLKLVN